MANEREIEIYEYRIVEADRLANVYAIYGISQEKINRQLDKKVKYETELEKIKPKI